MQSRAISSERHQKVFWEDSALTSGLLLFIFVRSGIFNRDLYKYEKSGHIFCCPYRGTLGAFHWREASLEVKRV